MQVSELLNELEKAFVSYVEKCLHGRSLRMQKKLGTLAKREKLILNEPCYEETNSAEKIDEMTNEDELSLEQKVLNELVISDTLEQLTQKF